MTKKTQSATYMREYCKKRYKALKDSWGDFEREYYILLNANDNLIKILRERYDNIFDAERELGYARGTLYSRLYYYCATARLKGLNKICQKLNLSLHYVIFGESPKEYSIKRLTFKNLYDTYMSSYTDNKNMKVTSAVCNAYNGKALSVPLKYIIRIAMEQRKNIDWLLEG